ncbi:MAG TPA: FAD-binding oxidoreductase [Pseudonocardiaceae bacterium]|nr:FAD-binding oxidoreductase [Pseudonocardiaceae bacterium]
MGITRRSFLLAGGVGATAAALAACSPSPTGTAGPSTTAPTSVPPSTPLTTASTAPKPVDFTALGRKLSGQLLTPDSSGYALARRSYNPLYDARRPAAVAMCRNTADVQACVTAAAGSTTPLAARSGGHSYAGYSTPTGALVVDVTGMSGVRVNADGTAVVAAGTRLIDVYSQLAAAGRALPGGSCPSVGIAGLTLGGGIGVLGRKYGLTCDRLVGATIVTADGHARSVSATDEPDLLWALRGGGGGNFGIVTSFTFETVPAPDLTVFALGFPAGAVVDAYGAWQPFLAAAPDELWTNFNITGGNPSTCTIAGCYVGPSSTVNSMLDTLVARIGHQPRYRTVHAESYLGAMRYFAGCASKSIAMCQAQTHGADWNREAFVASSRMMTNHVTDGSKIVDIADGHPNLHVIIDGLGGAIGRVAPDGTAFPHRSAMASVQVYLKTTTGARASAARQVATVRDALGPIVGEGAYVNYIDPTLPNWAQAYYGANLPRLRTVAGRYDPDRVFTFAQAVTA